MLRSQLLAAVLLLFSLLMVGCAAEPTPAVEVAVAPPTSEPTPIATPSATPRPTETPLPTATLVPTRTPIPTSTPIPTRSAPASRPVAVVVENDLAARPQTGLLAADVVYEAIAEWYLTRFVAVFTDGDAPRVGPTRSARAYHAAIAAEYEGIFAHCLDVPPVGAVIAQTNVRDFDGCRMQNPPGFDRDHDRVAPHNLYVTVADVRQAVGGEGTYGPFARRADWSAVAPTVSRLSFVYPTDHPVEWRYDPERREYLRWQDDERHLESGGEQVSAAAVVVQFVSVRDSVYFGESGYHEVALTGEGEAVVYAGGGKRAATWRRPGLAEPTRFVDAEGAEILLPPGRVFVQLVERGTELAEAR